MLAVVATKALLPLFGYAAKGGLQAAIQNPEVLKSAAILGVCRLGREAAKSNIANETAGSHGNGKKAAGGYAPSFTPPKIETQFTEQGQEVDETA